MVDVARRPAPDASHHKRVETPEERQRRKEKEKRHEQEKRRAQEKAAAAAKSRPTTPAVPAQPSNRLNRETPFLCNITFRNDLPEIPCDPRMLVAPLQPERLAKFALTSLEQNPRRELIVDPDSAIPVSMLDSERYAVPLMPGPLAPEDAALLQGGTRPAMDGPRSNLKPARERVRGSELSWLMRTSYISHEVDGRSKQQGVGEKRAKAIREADDVMVLDDREAHIAAIEATFAAAARPPVHLTNPALTPVEVMPVLPDFNRWGTNYVIISFDQDPTEDVDRFVGKSAEERRRITERSIVKSFSTQATEGHKDRFVAFMVPEHLKVDEDGNGPPEGQAGESMEGDYEWIREYNYNTQQDEDDIKRQFIFRLEPGAMTYTQICAKLKLAKRGKLVKGDGQPNSEITRPSQVTLRKRAANESEDDTSAKRLKELEVDEASRPASSPEATRSKGASRQGDKQRWASSSPSLSD